MSNVIHLSVRSSKHRIPIGPELRRQFEAMGIEGLTPNQSIKLLAARVVAFGDDACVALCRKLAAGEPVIGLLAEIMRHTPRKGAI